MLYLINAARDNSSSLVGCMSKCVYVTLPLSIIRFPTTLKDKFKVRYNKITNIWPLHFTLYKAPVHLSIISSKLDEKFNNNNHLKRSTYPHLGHVCQNLGVKMYFSHFKLQLRTYQIYHDNWRQPTILSIIFAFSDPKVVKFYNI